MNTLTTVRTAIEAEIQRLRLDLGRLQKVLATLDDGSPTASVKPGRPRGRRPKAKVDLKTVLAVIKDAGRINAVALAHKLKQQGVAPVKKAQLVALGVKVSGLKGGTIYSY